MGAIVVLELSGERPQLLILNSRGDEEMSRFRAIVGAVSLSLGMLVHGTGAPMSFTAQSNEDVRHWPVMPPPFSAFGNEPVRRPGRSKQIIRPRIERL